MRKLTALLCAATLALVAAGCGSSGGSDGSDTTTTTKAKTTTTAPGGDDTTTTDGNDDPEPTNVSEAAYVAAFTKGMSSGSADNGELVLTKEAAACVAPKFVAAATVEQLNEAGITAEAATDPGFDPSDAGLSEDQAQALVDAYGECDFDIYGELAKALTMGLADDVAACTAENIDHDLAEAMLVKTFSTGDADPEFEALLADLQTTCDLPAD